MSPGCITNDIHALEHSSNKIYSILNCCWSNCWRNPIDVNRGHACCRPTRNQIAWSTSTKNHEHPSRTDVEHVCNSLKRMFQIEMIRHSFPRIRHPFSHSSYWPCNGKAPMNSTRPVLLSNNAARTSSWSRFTCGPSSQRWKSWLWHCRMIKNKVQQGLRPPKSDNEKFQAFCFYCGLVLNGLARLQQIIHSTSEQFQSLKARNVRSVITDSCGFSCHPLKWLSLVNYESLTKGSDYPK